MHTRKMKAYALPLLLLLCAASATPQQRTITSVRGRAVLSAVDYSFERENERSFKLDLDKMDPAELRRIFAERRKRVMMHAAFALVPHTRGAPKILYAAASF